MVESLTQFIFCCTYPFPQYNDTEGEWQPLIKKNYSDIVYKILPNEESGQKIWLDEIGDLLAENF